MGEVVKLESRRVAEIEGMVLTRLYGGGGWLADRAAVEAIHRRLEQLGLQETVPDDPSATRSTALGRELHLDLLMVFLGIWAEGEVPRILEDYGLIDEIDSEELYDLMSVGVDPGRLLLPVVRAAYSEHHGHAGQSN